MIVSRTDPSGSVTSPTGTVCREGPLFDPTPKAGPASAELDFPGRLAEQRAERGRIDAIRRHDGLNHSQFQSCVQLVDYDVNPASPYKPHRQ